MKVKQLLSLLILLISSQAFALYHDAGNFFAKPADRQVVKSSLETMGLAKQNSRPERNFQYRTPEGYFIIHYDTTGIHAVPMDFNHNDSLPDFVVKAAEYLDASYNTLHRELGFSTPPVDHIDSPEIDVYFKYDLTYYGVTMFSNTGNTDPRPAYLTLSTELNDSTTFYTYGLEGLRVTCAHELFHIFQLGYRFRSQDIFYFEMSSVWFEEHMYPEVNDYHSYIEEYSQNWKYAINSGSLWYNNVGFNMYIDKRFSTESVNIIKNIWDRIRTVEALPAIKDELEAQGITFEEALRDWGTAQVLCGSYAAEGFAYAFNDASDLEPISFDNYEEMIVEGMAKDIGLTSNPGVFYYKLTDLPENVFLFDMIISEGSDANLVCLDSNRSEIKHFTGSPLLVDGNRFRECILVIGLDAENAIGSLSITEMFSDQLANIWPNPLGRNEELSLSYVLLEESNKADITIYDLKGRKLYSQSLATALKGAGLQELRIRPQNLASGIYIISLHTDEGVMAGKFTFIK